MCVGVCVEEKIAINLEDDGSEASTLVYLVCRTYYECRRPFPKCPETCAGTYYFYFIHCYDLYCFSSCCRILCACL